MRRNSGLVFLVSILIFSMPSVFIADEKADQEATKKFKQYVSDLIARYKAEKHERIEGCIMPSDHSGPPTSWKVEPGYAKVAYEVGTYGIDVRKTDSLITPYVGILELTWRSHFSRCQATKEKAQAESDLPEPGLFKYRYRYGFQDGEWTTQDREVQGAGEEWRSCKGVNQAMFGCAVSN